MLSIGKRFPRYYHSLQFESSTLRKQKLYSPQTKKDDNQSCRLSLYIHIRNIIRYSVFNKCRKYHF